MPLQNQNSSNDGMMHTYIILMHSYSDVQGNLSKWQGISNSKKNIDQFFKNSCKKCDILPGNKACETWYTFPAILMDLHFLVYAV